MKKLRRGILAVSAATLAVSILAPPGAAAAPVAQLTPATHGFGEQEVRTESESFDFTLANTGDGTVTVLSVTRMGENPGQFRLKGAGSCDPGVVLGGANPDCSVRVSFAPTSAGTKRATVQVVTDLSPTPLTVAVSGNALAEPTVRLGVSPVSMTFGSRRVSESPSSPRAVILTSRGSLPLNIGAVTVIGADASQFVVDTAGCANRTLGQNQSCAIPVFFDPDTIGTKLAVISIDSNAPNSPRLVSLAGTAKPAKPTRVRITPFLPRVRGSSASVRVPLRCYAGDAPACSGKLFVKVPGRAIGKRGLASRRMFAAGSRAYSLDRFRATVSVPLKPFALRALRRRGRLPLRITTTVRQPSGGYGLRNHFRTVKVWR